MNKSKYLYVTYLKIIFILLAGIFSAAEVMAQSENIALSATGLSAREVFDQIEKQTPYRFAYNSSVFDPSRKINLPATRMPLKDILDIVVDIPQVTYLIHEEIIIIGPVKDLMQLMEDKGENPLPPTVEETDTGDVYEATDIYGLRVLPFGRKPLPEIVPDTVHRVRVVVKSEPQDSIKTIIDARPATSVNVPIESYLVYKGLPKVSVKTNLVHWVVTASPNLSVDIGLGRHTSLEIYAANNRWKSSESLENTKKMGHWMVRPEFRYWLCERMNGHFFGVNASYWDYSVSGYNILSLFEKESRYKGNAIGVGVTYGYHMAIIPRLGLEFNVGVGVSRLKYDRFDHAGSDLKTDNYTKFYFGPTRADISLVFIIK